jgi:hypothetical protein
MAPYTRALFSDVLVYYAGLAAKFDVPASDVQAWEEAAKDPGKLLEDPDCCLREFFVLTVGKIAKAN